MDLIPVKKATLEIILQHINDHSYNFFWKSTGNYYNDPTFWKKMIREIGEFLLMNGSKVISRKQGTADRYFISTYSQVDTSFWKDAIRQIENEEFSCQVCVNRGK